MLLRFLTRLLQFGDAALEFGGALLKFSHLGVGVLPILGGALGVVANLNGTFQQVGFAGFLLAQGFGLVNQGFLGLLLLAV